MSTQSFHQGRPRLAAPDLPPTLTPNPIAAAAKAPSRALSSLCSLLVYGLFAAGGVGLAHGVAQAGPRGPVTQRIIDVELPPPTPPRLETLLPPPGRALVAPSQVMRPKDWTPEDLSNIPPVDTPTTLPDKDRSTYGAYTKDMPVAQDPSQVTDPRQIAGPPPNGTARVLEFSYSQVRVLRQAPVHYPPLARMARIQGPVELLITIDPAGVPSAVETVSGPAQLHAEAVRCAREWRFEPARADGQPVSARFRLTIHFRLLS